MYTHTHTHKEFIPVMFECSKKWLLAKSSTKGATCCASAASISFSTDVMVIVPRLSRYSPTSLNKMHQAYKKLVYGKGKLFKCLMKHHALKTSGGVKI
jgi:hypothetical protein